MDVGKVVSALPQPLGSEGEVATIMLMVAHDIEHFIIVLGTLSKEVAEDLTVWTLFLVDVFCCADISCEHENITLSRMKALRRVFTLEVEVREQGDVGQGGKKGISNLFYHKKAPDGAGL